jgi:hypothetical protein
MSNVRIPQGLWVALAALFAILFLLLLLKGMWLAAIVAVAAAVWTGLEASGRGAVTKS